jgi:uncharacterized membrane protein YfcA
METALTVASGVIVGYSLGLVGGGGSILAVPLLVYVVGVDNPHLAIGTSAIAVALNAAANLAQHARSGTVKWRCALIFAAAGVTGATLGSSLGKMMDGQWLLALFAVLMVLVGALMVRNREHIGSEQVRLSRDNVPKLVGLGLIAGTLSGFFGIGGGFLIVPSLMLATGMPTLNAVGSSLVAVTAFGLTTAANYAWSGLVDWPLVGLFVAGGLVGSLLGVRSATWLAARKGALNTIFAIVIFTIAGYILIRSFSIL